MRLNSRPAPGLGKVRRDVAGGKRGDGQKRTRRVRRPDPRTIRAGTPDPALTGVAGLIEFGAFCRARGLDHFFRETFGRLKTHPGVLYPMHTQLRLLVDAFVVGEARVFGLESLAADPLFVHLAGGVVPSIDILYDDLRRFDDAAIVALDERVGREGLQGVRTPRWKRVHLDLDTTVEVLFGTQEGALPGPNPRYHGRPSYHPILARLAETGTFVGAQLRPGNTGFGEADVPYAVTLVRRVRAAVGPTCEIVVRIDGAGDCLALLAALQAEPNTTFVTKADLDPPLCAAITQHRAWRTVDEDANGMPLVQVAEIDFARGVWTAAEKRFRVVAVRSRERETGKQIYLWADLEYTVQAFVTDRWGEAEEDGMVRYNDRAGIEPLIGEAKGAWGIGKVPSQDFHANHAALLLKLLAHNVFRQFAHQRAPALVRWRTPWLRRVLILRPGRLSRVGGRWQLRTRDLGPLAARRE